MSIKLLACVTLFLLVGAVLPFCLGPKSSTADPAIAKDTPSLLQPKPDGSATASVPVQIAPVAASSGTPAVVRVSAVSEQPAPPAAMTAIGATQRQPSPASTVAASLLPSQTPSETKPPLPPPPVAEPMYSSWPPPPATGQTPERQGGNSMAANANQAPPAHSPEYEANARGHRPGEPPAAQFDGTIEGTKR
jgi:hypothetical protein